MNYLKYVIIRTSPPPSVKLNRRRPPKFVRLRLSSNPTPSVPAPRSSPPRSTGLSTNTTRSSSCCSVRTIGMCLGSFFMLVFAHTCEKPETKNVLTYFCRLQNSNKLETSIQNGKNLLMPYENRLAREEIAPSDPTSLDMALRELSVRHCLYTNTSQRYIKNYLSATSNTHTHTLITYPI